MLQLKRSNFALLKPLKSGEDIGEFRLLLKDIDAIEKASANGEVIDDFDKGQERGAYEETGWAADGDCGKRNAIVIDEFNASQLTDEIQFSAHNVSLVPFGRQISQWHFDDRVRINLRIVNVIASFVDHEDVDFVAAWHTIANDSFAFARLAPRRDDDRQVFIVLVKTNQTVDFAVFAYLPITEIM